MKYGIFILAALFISNCGGVEPTVDDPHPWVVKNKTEENCCKVPVPYELCIDEIHEYINPPFDQNTDRARLDKILGQCIDAKNRAASYLAYWQSLEDPSCETICYIRMWKCKLVEAENCVLKVVELY